MRTVDMFPAEVHLHDGRILTSARVRIENGHARVWRWLNGVVTLEYEGRVTIGELKDESPHRPFVAKGMTRAHHLRATPPNHIPNDVAFTARSGGCECGGSWNLRDKVEGVPRL